MRMSGSAIELSASDLSGFLSCNHLTALDLAVARGQRPAPDWVDPVLIVLRERGLDHERGYVEELRAQDLSIADFRDVRFTPKSGHASVRVGCPKSANSGRRMRTSQSPN
jgi:hypothetical protein